MAGTFRVTFEMQKFFYDRQVVKKAIDRQQRRAISRSLAFVRRRARSLLRRRKRVSSAGSPPSVHSDPGLKTILFAYDMRTKGGIVGPVKLNQVNMTSSGSMPVSGIMELGGSVQIHEAQSNTDGKFYRLSRRTRTKPGQKKRVRTVKYPARPFMGPALEMESEAGNILSPWANVVGS